MKILATIVTALIIIPVIALATDNNVPRAIATNGPAEGIVPLELTELWRVGGEEGELIFGRITDVTRHPDGNIYVLDNQLCQVTVISPDGEYLKTISREGDGPGELRQPMALTFLSDDVLGVGLGYPGKLTSLNLDGDPVKSIFPIGEPADGNIGVMLSSRFRDGHLVSSGGRIVFGDPTIPPHTERFLTVGTGDLTEFHRILETTTPIDPAGLTYTETDCYYIDRRWTMGPEGKIYVPMTRDAYEVSVFDMEGKLLRVFGRQYEQRKRTQEEKDRVGPTINVTGNSETSGWNIEDHDESIVRIQYNDDDDTVWVLTPHGDNQTGNVLEQWDVFSPDGEYLRQVQVLLGDEIAEGNVHLVGDDVLLVVRGTAGSFGDGEEEEDDTEVEPLEVICYRIGQGPGMAGK